SLATRCRATPPGPRAGPTICLTQQRCRLRPPAPGCENGSLVERASFRQSVRERLERPHLDGAHRGRVAIRTRVAAFDDGARLPVDLPAVHVPAFGERKIHDPLV